ncbi:hypothetical protein PI125_g8817 [Phytophthora idaei]|nr:hypothetical protein PI125_g8817 [Phytophthora idaei]
MHKKTDMEIENGFGFEESATPADLLSKQSDPGNVSVNRPVRRSSKMSFVSVADSERHNKAVMASKQNLFERRTASKLILWLWKN